MNTNRVLKQLCEGDLSFKEACEILNVSRDELDELMDEYSYIPPASRIIELSKIERKTLDEM